MTSYQTRDGTPVPDPVAEHFDHPYEWENLDPKYVRTHECTFGTLYEGYIDGVAKFCDDNGHDYSRDHFDHVRQLKAGAIPRYNDSPFTYNGEPDLVNHDHYVEHVTKAIVVEGEGERTIVNSRSGVLWLDPIENMESAWAKELGIALAETKIPHGEDRCEIELPEEYERVVDGWHDSMFPSDQSDVVNALAQGDIPPEMSDDVFPYIVRFGDTHNCCSQPASIYANPEFRAEMKSLFEGKRSTPQIGGGFS